MESDKKLPALPLKTSQKKLPKKLSKAKTCLSAIEIFKLNALKALEHSDSGSEQDCIGSDEKGKESSPGGKNSQQDKLKFSKRAMLNNRRNSRHTTTSIGGKTARVRRNRVLKVNNRTRLPERSIDYLENRIERGPTLTVDVITEVATMVSEVTISDGERDSKSKNRKKEKLAPELSSPDLRRPSSAFRKKTNKAGISKQAQNKPDGAKEEIKDRPLVELQKYLKMMAECRQNSLGRPKMKPSLYVGSNITRKSEIGKKSILLRANTHHEAPSNRPVLTKQVSTTIPTGVEEIQPTLKENRIPPLTSEFEHSSMPHIKIIPPAEEKYKPCSNAEDDSSADGLSELLNKYPSEIPRSAKETWKIYVKLQEQGFPVSLKTLQRALMTPTDQRVLKELQTNTKRSLLGNSPT